VRDEYRADYDPGRGGYGKQKQLELEMMEKKRGAVEYLENLSEIPVGGDFGASTYGRRKRGRPSQSSPPHPSQEPSSSSSSNDGPALKRTKEEVRVTDQ